MNNRRLSLILSDEVATWLRNQAKKDKRTLTGEVEFLLEMARDDIENRDQTMAVATDD